MPLFFLGESLGRLPPLHGDPRLLTPPLWTNWQFDPFVLLGVFGLAAGYLVLTAPRNRQRAGQAPRPVSAAQRASFLGGCLVLLLALGPPLEDWAQLILAGHMLQHMLLTLVAPPLLLLGTPSWLLQPLLRSPLIARAGYWLTRPLVAFAVSGFTLILWHVPALYDPAIRSDPLHVVQHLSFLGTAILAWWPVVGPLPEWPRLTPPLQCIYLVALTLPNGIVGSSITLADPGLYPSYLELPRMWALSVEVDQQIAGLMMWGGGSGIYITLITIIFFRWAAREEGPGMRGA